MAKQYKNIDLYGDITSKQSKIRKISEIIPSLDANFDINFLLGSFHNIDISDGDETITFKLLNGSQESIIYKIILDNTNGVIDRNIEFYIYNVLDFPDIVIPSGEKFVMNITYDGSYFRFISNETTYLENTDYLNEYIISIGDNYKNAISKLDEVSNLLKPTPPANIDDLTLKADDVLLSTLKCDSNNLEDVLFEANITFNIDDFNDPETNKLQLLIDGSSVSSVILTENDDTSLLDDNIKISENNNNNFYSWLTTWYYLSKTNLPTKEDAYNINIKTTYDDKESLGVTLYSDDKLINLPPTAPTPITALSLGLPMISGIPVLKENYVVETNVTYINSVSYHRQEFLGEIYSPFIDENVLVESEIGSANTDQTISKNITIKSDVYGDFEYNVRTIRPHGEVTSWLSNLSYNINSLNLLVDSKTNTNLFGYDHNTPLTNNTNLMILGGVVQYPSGDYRNYETGSGVGDTELNYNSIADNRYLDLFLTVENKGTIEINFEDQVNFSNSAIESGEGYYLELSKDSGLTWLNANDAYLGYDVVSFGEGCLDVAKSTKSKKILTFGEIFSGDIIVRLTLDNLSAHTFSQNITLIEGEY